MIEHSFVVPTFGESPFLEACLESLQRQNRPSPIVVSTSTPFEGIEAVAARHGATLHLHAPNRGIGHDWNEAVGAAPSDWVTIAHHDDLYHPGYTQQMLIAAAGAPDAVLALCYGLEQIGETQSWTTTLMMVKRALTELAFLGRGVIRTHRAKRRLLAFGTPVICPSILLNKKALIPGFAFREDMKCNLDWAAWLELAGRQGAFVLCRDALVVQRRHAAAETTKAIALGWREQEDFAMFQQIWPTPIARGLMRLYRLSYATRKAGAD